MQVEKTIMIIFSWILVIIPLVVILFLFYRVLLNIIKRLCQEERREIEDVIERELDNEEQEINELYQNIESGVSSQEQYPIQLPESCSYIDYDKENKEYNCAICLDETKKNAVQTTCQHVFCDSCISIWLLNHNTCPCCRIEIV